MTPTQSKQAAAIMLKHSEDGWSIEFRDVVLRSEWRSLDDPAWDWIGKKYRARLIERIPTRTPLPIEHYKRGMEVASGISWSPYLILGKLSNEVLSCSRVDTSSIGLRIIDVEKWRWPNETEWRPAYTETVEERVVETLEVEGL